MLILIKYLNSDWTAMDAKIYAVLKNRESRLVTTLSGIYDINKLYYDGEFLYIMYEPVEGEEFHTQILKKSLKTGDEELL